jgi:Ca2+/Na+ antiporter
MRIYWYYYKVLYSSGYLSMAMLSDGRFYFFFNIMLWMLYVINAYWFFFILKTAHRILSGKDLKDVREQEQDGQKQNPKKD